MEWTVENWLVANRVFIAFLMLSDKIFFSFKLWNAQYAGNANDILLSKNIL